MECNRHIFCHFGPFFALPHYLPWKWKFGINVQNAWRYYAFINVYQKWRSWCMLPDIRDDIFCPFFCPLILLTPQKSKFCKNEKKRLEILSFCLCVPKTTIIWGMTPEMQSETHDFLSFWTIFLSCYPPNKLKNQNFEKMKKISGDFIILHMCTKNYDHMMYASWDMECNRHNFFPGDIIILH